MTIIESRMTELAQAHQANVEARVRVTAGGDWSELPALREQGECIADEIKATYEAFRAAA